jgi:hypothetical protein
MITIVILLISLCTVVFGIIPGIGHKIWDKEKKGFKRLTKSGRIIAVCSIVLIMMPAIQNYLQDKANSRQERLRIAAEKERYKELQKVYQKSLIDVKAKFDSSNTHTIITISKTLGSYGFKLDSVNLVLEKLKKSPSIIYEADKPVLAVSNDLSNPISLIRVANSPGSWDLSVALQSKDAGSSSLNISMRVFVSDSLNGQIFAIPSENYINHSIFERNKVLSKNEIVRMNLSLHDLPEFNLIYIWLFGNYKKVDHTGKFNVDEIYYFNKLSGTHGIIVGDTKKRIISTAP